MDNKTIFTSLDNFKLRKKPVKSYTELNEEFVDWVNENSIKLLNNRNKAELKAGEELKKMFKEVHEQVFFRIYGRCFFLDYYLPSLKLAVEVDGRYHKTRKLEDKQRDADFAGIGIKTVRISSSKVLSGKFVETFKAAITIKKKKQHKKKNKKSIELKEARRRLREHDRMKFNANWI